MTLPSQAATNMAKILETKYIDIRRVSVKEQSGTSIKAK